MNNKIFWERFEELGKQTRVSKSRGRMQIVTIYLYQVERKRIEEVGNETYYLLTSTLFSPIGNETARLLRNITGKEGVFPEKINYVGDSVSAVQAAIIKQAEHYKKKAEKSLKIYGSLVELAERVIK